MNLGDLLDVLLGLLCLLTHLLALGLYGFAFGSDRLGLLRVVGIAHRAGFDFGGDALGHGDLLAADLDFLVFFGLLLRGRIVLVVVLARCLLMILGSGIVRGVGIRQFSRLFQFVHG